MRQWLPAIVLLLAGCASAGSPPPPGTAQAAFIGPDTIQVTVSDYVPAQSVALVGPQGEVPAASIDTTRTAYAAAPSGGSLGIGLGGGGGGTFGGIGLGFPIGGGAPAGSYPGMVISTAAIRLPPEPPYASVWRDSQIRIQLGLPPNVKTITIPAPAPPAA